MNQSVEFQTAPSVRLVADAFGPVQGQPVLFFHGGGQTRHAWGDTAIRLSKQGYRTYCFDLRGHGDSSWSPDGTYRVEQYLDDIEAVVDDLNQAPVLVGASLGGLISLLFSGERAPTKLASLVLVDVAHRFESQGVTRILTFMRSHLDGFQSLDEAALAISKYLPHRNRSASKGGLQKVLRRGQDGRYRWHWDPRLLDSLEVSNYEQRLAQAARSIVVPTLLVRGQMSDVVSEEIATELEDLIPNAYRTDVSAARHMVAGDSNEPFSQAILEFLSEPCR